MAVDYTAGLVVGFAVFVATVILFIVSVICFWLCEIRPSERKAKRLLNTSGSSEGAEANRGFHGPEDEESSGKPEAEGEEEIHEIQIQTDDESTCNSITPKDASEFRAVLHQEQNGGEDRAVTTEVEMIEPSADSITSDTQSHQLDIPVEVLTFNKDARLGEGSETGDSGSVDESETRFAHVKQSPKPSRSRKISDPRMGEFMMDGHDRVKRPQSAKARGENISSLLAVFEQETAEGKIHLRGGSLKLDDRKPSGASESGHKSMVVGSVLMDEMGEPLYSQLSLDRKKPKRAKTVTFREPGDGKDSESVDMELDPPEVPEKRPDL